MKVLRPGNVYDFEEWGTFLELHHFDMGDVYRIDFLDDGRMTVHRYRRDKDGHRFREPGTTDAAILEPVTVTPKAPIPAWS